MPNVQLYFAIGVPILANAALIGLLLASMNARFDSANERFDSVIEICIKNAIVNAKKGAGRIGECSPAVSLATVESGQLIG